jgi:hypothetical protein
MHAATVSRFLGKTYRRSTTASTRIRGYSLTTAGFLVRQLPNAVSVSYTTGSWTSQSDINGINKNKAEMILSIRNTLISNGFQLNEASSGIVIIGKLEN